MPRGTYDFHHLAAHDRERQVRFYIPAIKVDVEGHEVFALRRAQRILNTHKPLLMVEGGNFDAEVTALLTSHGYFYWERVANRLVRTYEVSRRENGFWLHAEKAGHYVGLGLLEE